ncbi:heme peroxidase [Gorgonomyces haynaldii]|nr:heme peroxidase [Gorgonomyces haynaldii]
MLFLPLVACQTQQDFVSLRSELELYIAENPVEVAPPLVRMSFHDLFNFDPNTNQGGPRGCLAVDPILTDVENAGVGNDTVNLIAFVKDKFPNTPFSAGDIISFAGKVAMETIYPCMKIEWSYGRSECTNTSYPLVSPGGNISTLAEFQPFLTNYGLSASEMAILTAGSHGIATAAAALENTGFGNFDFAAVNSGKDWIERTLTADWTIETNEKNNTQYTTNLNGQTIMRLPSDMVFFPSVLEKIKGQPDQKLMSAQETLRTYVSKDRQVFDQDFARVFAKMLAIGTKTEKLTPYVDERTTSQCVDEFPYPLLYLAGWNTKNAVAFAATVVSALLGLAGLIYTSQ